MRYSPYRAANLLLFFIITYPLSLIQAQSTSDSSSPITHSSDDPTRQTNPRTIVGAVFGAVIGVSLIMVAILYWVRRQTRKALERREAGSTSRKNGRFGTQNTSIALDTSFQVPTGISSFTFEKKSTGTVPHSHLYHSYAKAPQLEARPFEPRRQESISISNSPTVPYQIPVVEPSVSTDTTPAAFAPRTSNERPIIRSLHRTNSDIFKPLPEPPSAPSPGGAASTPPPPPVHSIVFSGSSDPTGDTGDFERSQHPHAVVASASGVQLGRAFGSIGHTHHPYAPYAQDYGARIQRRGSDASTSSLGITLVASGSLAQERDPARWAATAGTGAGDSRPRSQSLSSLQYGNSYRRPSESQSQHQGNSIYNQCSVSQNPSTTSLSYYPDATSADGLARSYSQTVLARPESRASSITSKKFENQLFSR